MICLYIVVTLFFSMSVMIWERPFFSYTVSPSNMYIGREFSTLSNSIWYTLITMTTVGYGDVVVNTPVGRFIAILMIFTGAYLTALLIAVQSNLLSLRESGKSAIVQSTEQKSALDLIVAGLRLQVARSKRYRMCSSD